MRISWLVLGTLVLVGCDKTGNVTDTQETGTPTTTEDTDVATTPTGDADTDSDSDADADADADTDTTPTSACDAVTDGRYTATGQAFGMKMKADLAFDAMQCGFTLKNWDMAMDTPDGGTVAGDQVTLFGKGNYWKTCTGTLTGGNTIAGTCAQDGADFKLAL